MSGADRSAGSGAQPPVIGAGLKMYLGHRQTSEWIAGVAELAERHPGLRRGAVELFVLPTFPALVHAVVQRTPCGGRDRDDACAAGDRPCSERFRSGDARSTR